MGLLEKLVGKNKQETDREARERWTLDTIIESEIIRRQAKQIAKSYDFPVIPHRRRRTD